MKTNINPNQLLDTDVAFHENSEGLVIERFQEIPQTFRDELRAERENSMGVREGEYMRVASIPVAVIEKWMAEGFDFWRAEAKEIVARLKQESLDDFLTTKKTV